MLKIGAVILAAGMSKRMGQPKLLLPLQEKPLFRFPLELAIRNRLAPNILIGGQYTQVFRDETKDLDGFDLIENPSFSSGMASSLKLGIRQMIDRTDAAFIFLGDQPFVPDSVIQSMITEFEREKSKEVRIIRPKYKNKLGHPILIHKDLYSAFLEIEGDQGGKEIIIKYQSSAKILPFDCEDWGMDLDTKEEYELGKIIYTKVIND
ncbi:nucleotidyltransferase family protein [Niallia sp. Krafla_26]|uniref:nucleotidyltransferase family protein n=1 Tax=Niallia sp. Krafla_26 TaxID=3064703 RepID=UPI003D17C563